jgi:DNA-binding transcriptional regulator GbsR (MarR family)
MALSDAQWHRNMELIRETKLSSRTLSKHLDELTNGQFIEKKSDIINGKHAVFFKAKPDFITFIKLQMLKAKEISSLEPALNRTNDPLRILDLIHFRSQTYFLDLLTQIQQNKNITSEEINLRAEYFLWSTYRESTSQLIEASCKIIDRIDITQLLINQAKRQRKDPKKVLKQYEKIIEFKRSLQNQQS